MDDFEKELKIGFLEEALGSVAETEQCFLALEANPSDMDNLNKIFRHAHNLKGSSKAVGFVELGAFTHEYENFILKVKTCAIKATPKVVSLLLRVNDHVLYMLSALKENLDAKFDSTSYLEEMKNFSEDDQTNSTASNTVELASNENAPSLSVNTIQVAAANKSSNPDESIRVAVSKVETLLNFVGEMVILQSVLREQAQIIDSSLIRKTTNQLGKVSKEIQDISMSLRMVPVKPTFQKMQRIVRDTAQALNKDVGITLKGEETELDKTVLEKINDPLVHLIRNSVDHGIESAELRQQRQKPSKGQVILSAYHRSGKLVIEVSDDGGGLDSEKLKRKALEKGIIKPDAILSERETFSLIFAPGFSTKEVVTDVSGRGVGMDVVKTNIQDLGGEIQIESTLGKGTTFKIILPLTLAIIESMVVTYSGCRYVIPLGHVHETLRPTTKQIQSTTSLSDILLLRGENMPLFRLGDFFGQKSQQIAENMIAMVIRTGSKPFAILVDDIIGQYQVVTKQLGNELRDLKGVSGSTILGDGKPALILEPQDLLKRKITNGYTPINNIVGGKSA